MGHLHPGVPSPSSPPLLPLPVVQGMHTGGGWLCRESLQHHLHPIPNQSHLQEIPPRSIFTPSAHGFLAAGFPSCTQEQQGSQQSALLWALCKLPQLPAGCALPPQPTLLPRPSASPEPWTTFSTSSPPARLLSPSTNYGKAFGRLPPCSCYSVSSDLCAFIIIIIFIFF